MKVFANLYGDYVFTGDIGEVARVLGGAVYVESEYKDGERKYYPRIDTGQIQMSIINDSQLIEEEKETMEYLKKKLSAKTSESSKYWSESYEAKKQIEKLEAEIKTLKEVCPHNEVGQDKEEKEEAI